MGARDTRGPASAASAASASAAAAAAAASAAAAAAAASAAAAAAAAVGVPFSGSMSSVSSADEPPPERAVLRDKDGRAAGAPLPRTSSVTSSASASSADGGKAPPPPPPPPASPVKAGNATATAAATPAAAAAAAAAAVAAANGDDAADASSAPTDGAADLDVDSDASGASLSRPRMSTAVAAPLGALVTLHVYDLVDADHPGAVPALNTALWLTGIGLFHTGVVVNDVEYTYAGHWEQGVTGVVEGVPRAAPGAVFRTAIPYGRVERGTVDVEEVLDEVADAYEGAAYNLLTRNCNVFCDDLLRRLTGRGSPGWVNRLAGLAVRVRCLLPAGFDDPLSGPGARADGGGGGGTAAGAAADSDDDSDDDDGGGRGAAAAAGRRSSAAGSDGGGVGGFRGDAAHAVERDEARGSGSIADVAPLVAFVHRGGQAGRPVMPSPPAAAAAAAVVQ